MVHHAVDALALHIQSLWTVGAGACGLSLVIHSLLTEDSERSDVVFILDLSAHKDLTADKTNNYSQCLRKLILNSS